MRQTRILGGTLAMLAMLLAAPAFAADKPKLVVLDIELTGDTGGPAFAAEHEARLRMESDRLRQELQQTGLYDIIDVAPARPLITKLQSQQKYLHDCNGCDLEIGHHLHADQVVVTWVDRVPAANRAMNSFNCATFFSRCSFCASSWERICVFATTISSYPPV